MERSYLFTHNSVEKNMHVFLYSELVVPFALAQLEF